MLRFKSEVRVSDCDERLVVVLREACLWSLRTRVDVEINSIEDGPAVHMAGSLHGVGLAVDVDTVGDRAPDIEELAEWFRRRLPATYDVVFEGDHVHVEYDAHRRPLLARPT